MIRRACRWLTHWLTNWLSPNETRKLIRALEKQMANDKDAVVAELNSAKAEIADVKSKVGTLGGTLVSLNQTIADLKDQLAKQSLPQEVVDAADGVAASAKDLQDAFNALVNPPAP